MVWTMPPHAGSVSLRQTPVQGGGCPACLGTGEQYIATVQLNPPASDFVYLGFMSDNWQGIGSARAMRDQLNRQIADYEQKQANAQVSSNAPVMK